MQRYQTTARRLEREIIQHEALSRARAGQSTANYAAIFEGFAAKGIAADDIEPRVNVLTFNAWKAAGRSVRAGEHGVKVVTFVERVVKGADGEGGVVAKMPRAVTVFHISQTEAL